MEFRFSILLICHLAIVTAFSQPTKYKKIQRIIDEATRGRITGVVVYIKTPGGDWSAASGLADVERSIAMDTNYVFATGSISKMYTAAASMKLVEQGKFQLEDKISLYLPEEIVSNIEHGKDITIRHLIGNTSGIYNYEFDSDLNELYLSGRLKLDTLSHLNVLRRYVYGKQATNLPGEEFHYSSTNFMLMAMIMDRVCPGGHTFFLRENVIAETGLLNTYYRSRPENLVSHYGDINKDGALENLTSQTIETTNWFIGDDGIYATVNDAARFLESLMKEKIVRRSSLEQMTKWNNSRKPDYGLGLMADKSFPYKFLIGHSGRGIGTTTDLFYFPNQDMTVALFCNVGIRNSADAFRKSYLKMRSKIVKRLFLF